MSPPRVPQSGSIAFVRALGAAVRARRLRLKLTHAHLARRSGLSEAAIIKVEAGDPDLDLVQLVGIAEALEIPVRTLLQRAERRVRWRGNGAGSAAPRGNGAKKDKKGKRRR
jgi:transcriptional regulator with XRE-family HTH domain